MGQIFHPSFNSLAKATLIGGALLVGVVLAKGNVFFRSPYMTKVGVAREQVVPFSHKHHVAGLGLDCRYCHTAVEKSASAGIPSTKVCMTCHSQVWTEAPLLEPVRRSFASGERLQWTRVHDVPDFVFFNHSIHVAKGVSCKTCHGRVDQMPLVWKENTLHMSWCLDCHRHPEKYVQPKETVFDMNFDPSTLPENHGQQLVEKYGIHKEQLTNCSMCHR